MEEASKFLPCFTYQQGLIMIKSVHRSLLLWTCFAANQIIFKSHYFIGPSGIYEIGGVRINPGVINSLL